jgi:hypothetical protein
MADFELTTPDGAKYKVTAETEEQAFAALQKMLGAQPAAEEKPGVLSRLMASISGANADPSIPSMMDARLGFPPAKAAQMTALLATTRSPDRLRSGILKIEPDAEFGEDDAGRLFAVLPVYRDGEKTGQFSRVYPNEPGLGITDVMQAAGVVAAAPPIARGLSVVGLPTTGLRGAATIGATEAALVEGASSALSGSPFQFTDIPIGAAGGVAGEKLFNVIGSLVSAAQRGGADRVLGPDGQLLPGPARLVQEAGLDPQEVTAAVAAEIQRQARAGVEPSAAAVTAMSRGLPVEVPMTRGQVTGSKGQQLAEDMMASGVYGTAAERTMAGFRTGQQEALRGNITAITEGIAPGSAPVAKGEGGRLAQEALVAARSGDKARADDLYAQARASGAANVQPDEALNIADAARTTYREGFDPITAPQMDGLLLRLDEIMANGGDIKALQTWRKQVSNLRSGAPTVEAAAAGKVLRDFDERLTAAVDNQLLIGDQSAVSAWKNAITNWAEYAKTWESKGGVLNVLTEKVTRDGQRQLKVAPEEAANAIFTMTASGLASKTKLPRDLLTLKSKLPEAEWNALRQEALIRLTDTAEGAFRGGERQVSGVNFKKSWENLQRNNPGVVNNLFSKAERDTITQFANVAARATNAAINASNSANAAAGWIQRMAFAFTASGPGQFLIQNYLAGIIREPYGAMRAASSTAQRLAPRQIVGTPRAGAVGAGTGAALSQEEEIGPRIPITGRMTVGGQQ